MMNMKIAIDKTSTKGRKPTVHPMGFLADLGTKLMHDEPLTETECGYLRMLLPDEGLSDLHISLHYCDGASLTEDQRGVLQLLLERESVRLYGGVE